VSIRSSTTVLFSRASFITDLLVYYCFIKVAYYYGGNAAIGYPFSYFAKMSNNNTTSPTQFITVLPHEPLPKQQDDNTTTSQYGYIHIQGSFLPKRKESKDTNNNNSTLVDDCKCTSLQYIQTTLTSSLTTLFKLWYIPPTTLIKVTPISSIIPITGGTKVGQVEVTKVRLTVESANIARIVTSRLRSGNYTPRDLMCSTIAMSSSLNGAEEEGEGEGRDEMIEVTVHNDGLCTHGCDGRYGGKVLMVTQITTTTSTSSSTTSGSPSPSAVENPLETKRWAKAAPPKFRKLQLVSPSTALIPLSTAKQIKSTKIQTLTEDELESRRGNTRFVNIMNLLNVDNVCGSGSGGLSVEVVNDNGQLNEEKVKEMKQHLLSILHGKKKKSLSTTSNGNNGGGKGKNTTSGRSIQGMIEDDISHAFQDALRSALVRDDIVSATTPPTTTNANNTTTASTKQGEQRQEENQQYHDGVELFLKTDTTNGIKVLYDSLHIGLRSNYDASMLLSKWQGQRVVLELVLPVSFVRRYLTDGGIKSSDGSIGDEKKVTVKITTGKLFIDYVDVLLPNRPKFRLKSNDNQSSSSSSTKDGRVQGDNGEGPECTSQTSHIHIPGLKLIPNFVTTNEENILLAVLTGPHAPWSPPQITSNQLGYIKRRVQHYGYVFDYESSDVLRRDANEEEEGEEKKKKRSACPPLPSMKTSREVVSNMTNEEVEQYISKSVKNVNGWELLAGVIERIRRFDFGSITEENGEKKNEGDKKTSEKEEVEENEDARTTEILSTFNAAVSRLEGLDMKDQVAALTSMIDGLDQDEKRLTANKKAALSSTSVSSSSSQSNDDCTTATTETYPHINQLTLNEYTPGQGIGSHVDTESAFDDGLLALTLNGGIVMEFRQVDSDDAEPKKKKLVYLPPRSLLLLSKDARYKWEHMIVSRKTDTVDGVVLPRKLRVSLTLRTALTAPQVGQQAKPLPIYESNTFPLRWGQLSDAKAAASSTTTNGSVTSSSNGQSLARSDLITPSTESKHVHDVYDAIATQWHHTRGKRGVLWPGATHFLEQIPRGSMVADVGCGDGKYFSAIWEYGSYVIGTDIR